MPVSDKPITCQYRWSASGQSLRVAWHCSGGTGPAWLLLPALSTISCRSEWQAFSSALLERIRDGIVLINHFNDLILAKQPFKKRRS